jgi:oligopeptide/dipeptide ABC transporter ATP-binding protein
MSESNPILSVKDLRIVYPLDRGVVQAVNNISFDMYAGRTLTIVGESGSGKSTVAHAILGILPPPGRFAGGEVLFKGRNLLALPEEEKRRLRGRDICMVLQNPLGAFDPVYTVGQQIVEAIVAHQHVGRTEAKQRTIELLANVGIPHPKLRFDQYPHQFSGGMSQRALIAMALAGNPQVLVADEPTSALDVTVQAQIMELLRELRDKFGLAILLITHDLGLAALIGDDVAVMYAGRIVESGPVDGIFYHPGHPYTAALLNSIVRPGQPRGGRLAAIEGAPPDLVAPPRGCSFHPRCRYVATICRRVEPPLLEDNEGGRVACHLAEQLKSRFEIQT